MIDIIIAYFLGQLFNIYTDDVRGCKEQKVSVCHKTSGVIIVLYTLWCLLDLFNTVYTNTICFKDKDKDKDKVCIDLREVI